MIEAQTRQSPLIADSMRSSGGKGVPKSRCATCPQIFRRLLIVISEAPSNFWRLGPWNLKNWRWLWCHWRRDSRLWRDRFERSCFIFNSLNDRELSLRGWREAWRVSAPGAPAQL